MRHLLFLLPFLLFVVGCSDSNEEPLVINYKLTTHNQNVTILDNGKNASLNVIGYDADYTLDISGDFVNIVFDANVDWLSASFSAGTITIHANAIDNTLDDSRTGKINFTVFNDSKSASGFISVTQRVITYEDLLAYENDAINYFLRNQSVVQQIPENNNFKVGDDAPYYVLSSNPFVAMKVIDRGSDDKPKDNDRVYFRFSRANLLSYFQTGELVEDWNSIVTNSHCSFRLNDFITSSSAQWGKAIQMPFHYGLGYNATVQLVVSSPVGFSNEISNVTPYLYTISYYKGEDVPDEIPPSLVYIPFATEAEWISFAPTSALTWQFFNKKKNIPSSLNFTENSATGFGGVLVVSNIYGMQDAYDAACPVECREDVTLFIDIDNMNAYCPVCGSRYDVFSNYGAPLSGKALELRCAPVRYTISSTSNFFKVITN